MEKWTIEKYNKLVEDLRIDCQNEGWNEHPDMIRDVADGIISCDRGLERFMREELGVSDPVGRLAGEI